MGSFVCCFGRQENRPAVWPSHVHVGRQVGSKVGGGNV